MVEFDLLFELAHLKGYRQAAAGQYRLQVLYEDVKECTPYRHPCVQVPAAAYFHTQVNKAVLRIAIPYPEIFTADGPAANSRQWENPTVCSSKVHFFHQTREIQLCSREIGGVLVYEVRHQVCSWRSTIPTVQPTAKMGMGR